MVSPTNTKWKIRLASADYLFKRPLKQTFPMKPIVVIAEPVNMVLTREISLFFSYFR
jgi:hypothetical protein